MLTRGVEERKLGWSLRFGRDQAGADRESDQAGNVANAETFHQLRAVVLHGLDAQLEDASDLFRPVALCNQLQNLPLPWANFLK